MPHWYHGTNKKNANIIRREGFKEGTFFAKHVEDAIGMGGDYIFWVWFENNPTEYWEWVSDRIISPNKIYALDHIVPNEIFLNKKLDLHIKKSLVKKRTNGKKRLCEHCQGRGQMEIIPRYSRGFGKQKITTCPVCNGYGCK